MKMRLLFSLLSLLVSISALAQTKVQDTFYGVKIRSCYDDLKASEDLREIIRDIYKYDNWGYRHAYDWVDGEKERLRFPRMLFGGRTWDYCEYYFNNDMEFYQIRFYSGKTEPETTRSMYDSLQKDLLKKYDGQNGIDINEDSEWEDDLAISTTFTGNNGMTCELKYSYEAANNGKMYYYCLLYYYDPEMKEAAKYAYMEEL
ncbi:MAG: hypothetical protein IAB93_02350 [Bacteroidetes bacterium]|uniref:Uncharacterized protein n=1 Tax=Candidatus Merdivivens pullistercoris TaxID=2840873 RepID=A0A9D9N8V5_9BACT|nr:hypothetical protein [Candidatus Merdivivens pullistercoris]